MHIYIQIYVYICTVFILHKQKSTLKTATSRFYKYIPRDSSFFGRVRGRVPAIKEASMRRNAKKEPVSITPTPPPSLWRERKKEQKAAVS